MRKAAREHDTASDRAAMGHLNRFVREDGVREASEVGHQEGKHDPTYHRCHIPQQTSHMQRVATVFSCVSAEVILVLAWFRSPLSRRSLIGSRSVSNPSGDICG